VDGETGFLEQQERARHVEFDVVRMRADGERGRRASRRGNWFAGAASHSRQ
jgi:hypothetical protein